GEIADAAVRDGDARFAQFRDRIGERVTSMKSGTYLANEAWRVDRETVYADMYAQCGRGLGEAVTPLPEQIAPQRGQDHYAVERELGRIVRKRFGRADSESPHVDELIACLMDFVMREQAILRAGCAVQARINRLLGRVAPRRPFG